MNEIYKSYRVKLKQLHRIKMVLMHLSKKEKLTESPRTHEALQVSMVITLIAGALGFALGQLQENYFLFLLMAVFLIVAITTYKKSTRKDTWLEELDSKLMDYEPANVHAYQNLQDEMSTADLTRISGFLPSIEEWLMVERQTVKELLNPVPINLDTVHENKQVQRLKFIDKIVNKTE